MSIQITSTTDSEKVVTAAMGGTVKAEPKVDEIKSASAEKAEETKEESETSEDLESSDADESEAEAQDDEKESKEDDESLDGEQKPKKNGVQKRINKLVKKNSEKDREIEYLRKELMKKGSEQPDKPETKAPAKETLEGKPKADDFEDHSDYIEALTDWKLEQKEKAKEAAKKAEDLKSDYQKQLDKHNEKIREFKKAQEDYEEVITEFIEEHGDLKFSVALEDSILASDVGPQLVYHLAKNKEELDRINSMSALAAAREIGKLEARLSKKSESNIQKKQSKAPAPIEPVNSGRSSSVRKSIYDESLSQAEYEKLRMAQKAKGA